MGRLAGEGDARNISFQSLSFIESIKNTVVLKKKSSLDHWHRTKALLSIPGKVCWLLV